MDKVTAVVLNYNSSQDTKKCLSFLSKQSYQELSIVVVDNASTNKGEKDALKTLQSQYCFILLLSDNNNGFSAGNNIGIRYAIEHNSEWVLIINPDVEIRDTEYIKNVLLVKNNWQKVGIIGTKSILPDGYNQNPLRELSAVEEINYFSTYRKEKKYGREYYKSADKTGYCDKLVGCCFFASTEFLQRNGLMDENVFMYSEEPIIAKSAINLGYKLLYISELEVFHQHYEKSKPGSTNDRMLRALRSRKYYIKKYSGYNPIEKLFALLVKNIQIMIWRIR